jgi:Ca-activated chloride channel family protein
MSFIDIQFLDKYYFLLILFVPLLIIFFHRKQKNTNNFKFLGDLKKVFKNNFYIFYIKVILLCLIFIFYIIVIANPNLSNQKQEITKNGIDVVFALDLSYSMNANDISPTRLQSAKAILNDFLNSQKTNRF